MKRFFVVGVLLGWVLAHARSIAQPQSCIAYVRCYEATGGIKGSLDSSYGPMGTCWTTTEMRYWDCADECVALQTDRIAMHPDAGCKPLTKVERPRGCGI